MALGDFLPITDFPIIENNYPWYEDLSTEERASLNEVYLKETFLDESVGNRLPLHWQSVSGSFEIKENTGEKYIECISNGVISTQSNQAYGTWEFDICKGTATNVPYYTFISDGTDSFISNDGYIVYISSNNQIWFRASRRGTSALLLMRTYVDYIQPEVKYRIKITRDVSNEFTIYIKGGTFGDDFVLMDTSVTGANPVVDSTHTTSSYITHTLGIGDQIRNIKLNKDIII